MSVIFRMRSSPDRSHSIRPTRSFTSLPGRSGFIPTMLPPSLMPPAANAAVTMEGNVSDDASGLSCLSPGNAMPLSVSTGPIPRATFAQRGFQGNPQVPSLTMAALTPKGNDLAGSPISPSNRDMHPYLSARRGSVPNLPSHTTPRARKTSPPPPAMGEFSRRRSMQRLPLSSARIHAARKKSLSPASRSMLSSSLSQRSWAQHLTLSDVSTEISEAESLSESGSDIDLKDQAARVKGLESKSPYPNMSPTFGLSTRRQLYAGAFTRQGRKMQYPGFPNQDVHLVVPLNSELMLVAIFDGHGFDGHRSASCVREVFEQNAQHLQWVPTTARVEVLGGLFQRAQALLVQQGLAHYSGTSATVGLIDMHTGLVLVAHVGDSTLAIVRGSEVVATTRDHKVDDVAERRVVAHGGEVRTMSAGDTRRICAPGSSFPGLAMARSLGDQEAQCLGASCEPEISYLRLCPDSTLIVASDGVWDMLSPEATTQYVAIASDGNDCGRFAKTIVDEARRRYPAAGDIDDITAVVVKTGPLF